MSALRLGRDACFRVAGRPLFCSELGFLELEWRIICEERSNVLRLCSLKYLKTKLGQVMLMILAVKFFEKASAFSPKAALDFFCTGALALWLVQAREKPANNLWLFLK
ncbi:MAG: YqhA family protein [Meiothermus sp.]|uniref:YqhA family protein n=1 Tax=Meiothermus sp. TaxID=1955249 RepID=UPI0025FCC6C0|nr:YqhA family protein [Meiothermus sp.]MCS7067844.1 YqhA family protein [Meiothermus sp.]